MNFLNNQILPFTCDYFIQAQHKYKNLLKLINMISKFPIKKINIVYTIYRKDILSNM